MSDHLVGVISDTHGLLRREAVDALRGVEQIIHAGDVGTVEVLEALEALAPVTAVRGNVDHGTWTEAMPNSQVVDIGGLLLYILHDVDELDIDPGAAGFGVVVYGHSHQPSLEWHKGVLFLNPGSAGPRRFSLPVSLARVRIRDGQPHAELVELQV